MNSRGAGRVLPPRHPHSAGVSDEAAGGHAEDDGWGAGALQSESLFVRYCDFLASRFVLRAHGKTDPFCKALSEQDETTLRRISHMGDDKKEKS